MHGQKYRKLASRWQRTSLVSFSICLTAAVPAFGQAQTGTGTGNPAEMLVETPEAAAGMIVYIDPSTGEVLSGPAPGAQPLQLSPAERNALSTSHQGLVQVPSTVPGGGVKLDLRGRFQSPLIAVVAADGTANVHHLEDLPWLEELPWAGDKP